MYYITATPTGIEGTVREITTMYSTLEKVFDFLRSKTNVQRSRYYVRSVDNAGLDSGLVYGPSDIEKRLAGLQVF